MIAGYGFADKKTVLKMVGLTLGIHDFKIIDDASDALAIAIITASGSFENKISNNY
jgi:Holliday junction resolvasome RuvABC endonuclease subunit